MISRTTNERLQEIVNAYVKHGEYKAAQLLGIKISSLERTLREARTRGIIHSEEKIAPKRPNVLLFDIETSPIMFWGWKCGEQYIGPDQILTDWYVYSWSVKWLMEADVYSDVITGEESLLNDDKRIVENIWKYLDSADIIIAHNAWGFDVRKLNTRFIYYDMPPPSPYLVIDTLKVMRRQALFSSNKQDFLCKTLGLSRKIEHEGYSLWLKCWHGEEESLAKMLEYNKGDIMGLEELYLRIRPYIKSHPNMNLFVEGDGDACPNCGSKMIRWMDKFYATAVNKYSCFRCDECGSIGRAKTTAIDKDHKIGVNSVAR
jgi:DNA polymerase III epsilon subunit-like protein